MKIDPYKVHYRKIIVTINSRIINLASASRDIRVNSRYISTPLTAGSLIEVSLKLQYVCQDYECRKMKLFIVVGFQILLISSALGASLCTDGQTPIPLAFQANSSFYPAHYIVDTAVKRRVDAKLACKDAVGISGQSLINLQDQLAYQRLQTILQGI